MSEQRDRFHALIGRVLTRHVANLAGRGPVYPEDLPSLVGDLPWFAVRSEAQRQADGEDQTDPPGVATVYILDEIGGSMGVSASSLVRQIDAITEPQIHVRINSPGGLVSDAITIHSALLHHPAKVRSYVDGYALSAASVIAMAADPLDAEADTGGVVVMPGGQMMIHDASMPIDGNQADLEHGATFLGRQSDNVAGLYARRAGGTTQEWRDLMLAETWMFADEAVEMGLADQVMAPPPAPEPAMAEALERAHDLSRFHYRGRRNPPRRAVGAGDARPSGGARVIERTVGDVAAARLRVGAERASLPTPAADLAAAAAARGEASERRAHALAQEGRSVPVLRTSELFRTQLRVVRAEMPMDVGAARLQGFNSQLQCLATERRNGVDLEHIAGYASMYGRACAYEMWDTFGPYKEWVQERGGEVSLASDPDVAFLTNHLGVTMARTRASAGRVPTLELAEDERGLADDAYVNPERADVQLLLIAIRDDNVTEQSFAFMIDEGRWNEDFAEFCIVRYDIDRGDVSAVNYGANPFTSISARSQQILADLDRMPPGMAEAALTRLNRRTDVAGRLLRSAVLGATCPECGAAVPADAAYCPACGTKMPPADSAEGGEPPVEQRAPVAMGRRITSIESLIGDD